LRKQVTRLICSSKLEIYAEMEWHSRSTIILVLVRHCLGEWVGWRNWMHQLSWKWQVQHSWTVKVGSRLITCYKFLAEWIIVHACTHGYALLVH